MEERYQVSLLGGLLLRWAGIDRTPPQGHKASSLLAYLAYYRQRAHSREELIELFWPDSAPAAGRLSLRVALTDLRRRLAVPGDSPGILVADRESVRMRPEAVSTDVAAFELGLAEVEKGTDQAGQIHALRCAADLYQGELLPGYYDEWVVAERGRLADAYLACLIRLSALLQESGNPNAAIEYAHRAVTLDPLNEDAQLRLIGLYAATNRSAAAIRQYQVFSKKMRADLGAMPSDEARCLVTRLIEEFKAARTTVMRSQSSSAATVPAPEALSGTLPLSLTSFFGREPEIVRLRAMLDPTRTTGTRLVTLTGMGGIGKTRLAVETASRLMEQYETAVWFVGLEHLSDASRLLEVVADALDIPRDPQTPVEAQIGLALSLRPALFVLDNMEHLLQDPKDRTAIGSQLSCLLNRVPGSRCLVTSRERLSICGEREIPVTPLTVPDPASIMKLLAQVVSVRLFVERARLCRPDFELTPSNAVHVAMLCARLDGIPLAIELAAGWSSVLEPCQVLDELSSTLDRLVSRTSNTPARHRSLHAVLESSYARLQAPLQGLMARLSVFRGAFDVEAVRAVCGDGIEVVSALAALVETSLVMPEGSGTEMRFRLLETVRTFAAARLPDEEREEAVRWHAAFYAAMAETGEEGLRGAEQRDWLRRLQVSAADLDAALRTMETQEAGLRMAASLTSFWLMTGRMDEGIKRLSTALEANKEAPASLRAKAILGKAALSYALGESRRAGEFETEALRLIRRMDDPNRIEEALRPLADPILLHLIGHIHIPRRTAAVRDTGLRAFALAACGIRERLHGKYDKARKHYGESLALYRGRGDRRGIAAVLFRIADLAIEAGDYREALRCLEESLHQYRLTDDQFGIVAMLATIAYIYNRQADYARAEMLLEETLERSRRMGTGELVSKSLWLLATPVARRGNYARAMALLNEGLALQRDLGSTVNLSDTVLCAGVLSYEMGATCDARRFLLEAVDIRRQGTDLLDIAGSLCALGNLELFESNESTAESLYREALDLSLARNGPFFIAMAHLGLGRVACRRGDAGVAEPHLIESLRLSRQIMDRLVAIQCIEALAELRLLQSDPSSSAKLFGAARAARDNLGTQLPPCDRPRYDQTLDQLRSMLGNETFESALVRGARAKEAFA